MKRQYAVITADVIGSKEYTSDVHNNSDEVTSIDNSKQDFDKKIISLNKRINDAGIKTLTPFKSSRGDEVQVVCDQLEHIPILIRTMRFYCLPFNLRIGIGIGEINYLYDTFYNDNLVYNELAIDLINKFPDKINNGFDILAKNFILTNNEVKKFLIDYKKNHSINEDNILDKFYYFLNSWDMNGKAFYKARKALDDIKEKKEISTKICMDDNEWELAIQTIFDLIDMHIGQWSNSKWKSIQKYDEYGTYEKAAGELKITLQAIQKNCDSANWKIIRNCELNLQQIFKYLSNNFSKINSNNELNNKSTDELLGEET